MAGIGGYYYIGGAGGFLGSDGLNGVDFQIEVWHADLMSLNVKYHSYNHRPISIGMKGFVPNGPNDPDMLRKALILFASNLFASCPSFDKVVKECEGIESINFSYNYNIPKHFNDLLEESKQIDLTDKIHVYYSELYEINLKNI